MQPVPRLIPAKPVKEDLPSTQQLELAKPVEWITALNVNQAQAPVVDARMAIFPLEEILNAPSVKLDARSVIRLAQLYVRDVDQDTF